MEGRQTGTRTPQEEREQHQRESLITGITKLMRLGAQFTKTGLQTRGSATDFLTFAELFARESKGQHPSTFARRKAEQLEQALKEVRETTTPEHYEGHPVYEYAAQYIGYLQGIREDAEQPATNSTGEANQRKAALDFVAYFADKTRYSKVVDVLRLHHETGKTAQAARIILAAQELGYIKKNIAAAPLHRALQKILPTIGGERAFRAAFKLGADPTEASNYKEELQQA